MNSSGKIPDSIIDSKLTLSCAKKSSSLGFVEPSLIWAASCNSSPTVMW